MTAPRIYTYSETLSPHSDLPAGIEPTTGSAADWDLVIVMQYEAMWLGWQGGICKPAPAIHPPRTPMP